jgi:hypothetical protein
MENLTHSRQAIIGGYNKFQPKNVHKQLTVAQKSSENPTHQVTQYVNKTKQNIIKNKQ